MTQTSSRLPAETPSIRDSPTLLWGGALRFAAVGVGGVAVNLLALHLLYSVGHVSLLWASPASVELAVVHNYLVNDRWTFRRPRPSLARFAAFNLSALVALVVNVVVVWTLVASGTHYLVGNLVGIGAGAALNFGISASWVWRGGTR